MRIFKKSVNGLWNRNFTAFSASMFLTYLSDVGVSFVLSLMVLELTNSVLLYGFYLVLYYSASVFVPIVIGPLLERCRKKNINALCNVLTAPVYGIFLVLHLCGISSMAFIFFMAIITGILQAVYYVSSNALLLEIVEPSKLQKAYSVYSAIEISSEISVPLITFLYKLTGLTNILVVSIPIFFVAAFISVRFISEKEKKPASLEKSSFGGELKDGLRFVWSKKPYFIVCLTFMLLFMTSGVRRAVWLPYFEAMEGNSYLWYFAVYAAFSTAIFHASLLLYVWKIKPRMRYAISIISFLILSCGMVAALYLSNVLAVILAYFVGLFEGIFSNMRSISVYDKLDESQRARFSGIFTAFTNLGLVLGMGCSSVLTPFFSLKTVNAVLGLSIAGIFLGICFLWGGKQLKQLYNGCD